VQIKAKNGGYKFMYSPFFSNPFAVSNRGNSHCLRRQFFLNALITVSERRE
jgi:hypothetical protein